MRFNGRRFHTVLCCDLCSVPHSQWDCVPEYLHHQYGPKQEKQHIMQRRHVYSVAGTTGSVWVTLQMKQGTGGVVGEEGRRGLVAMGACILRANPWWFDWGPWQWKALTFDPVQPASLCHSQTHLREPRADCPKIVSSLIRRIITFFFLNENLSGVSHALPLKRPYVCDQWCRYLGVNCLIHCRGLIRFLNHLYREWSSRNVFILTPTHLAICTVLLANRFAASAWGETRFSPWLWRKRMKR